MEAKRKSYTALHSIQSTGSRLPFKIALFVLFVE